MSCFISIQHAFSYGREKKFFSFIYRPYYTVFACFLQTQRREQPRVFQPVGSSTLPLFTSVMRTRRCTSVPERFCLLSTSLISVRSRFTEMYEPSSYRNMTTMLQIGRFTRILQQYESYCVALLQFTWKTPDKKREECSFKGKDLQASELPM